MREAWLTIIQNQKPQVQVSSAGPGWFADFVTDSL
jgi:hypothetical protein